LVSKLGRARLCDHALARRRQLIVEPLEPRMLLTALPASVEDATRDVLAALRDNVRTAISGNTRMLTLLPLLGATIGEDLDLQTILGDHLYDPISTYLAGAPTVEGLGPQLDAISVSTADLTIDVNAVSVTVDSTDPADPQLVINFTLDATASEDLTAAFPSSYIQVENTTLTVDHTLSLPVNITIPFTSDPIAPEEVFINLQSAQISSSVSGMVAAKADFGLLGLDITSPTLNLNLTLDLDLAGGDAGGNLSLTQLTSGALSTNLSLTPAASSLDLVLPVSTTLAGISLGISPQLSINIADVFSGAAPTWSLSSGLSSLTDFQNLHPADVFGLLTQLGTKLNDITAAMDLDIPFVDQTVSDIAVLSTKLNEFLTGLQTGDGGYTYNNFQDLISELAGLLSLTAGSFNLHYDPAANSVLLDFTPSWTFSQDVLLDFSEQSGLLSITALADAQLNATATLDLTLGFDLDALPALHTLSERFFIASGSSLDLAAELSATNINVGASIAAIGLFVTDGTLDFNIATTITTKDPATDANDSRAYFNEIYASEIGDLLTIASPTVGVSGELPLDAGAAAMNTLLGIDTTSTASRPALLMSLGTANDLSTFTLAGDAEFQSLLEDFTDFSDLSLWDAIGQLVNFLKSADIEAFNEPLPLINQSVNDLMGLADGILTNAGNLNTDFNQIKTDINAQLAALDAAIVTAVTGLDSTQQAKLFHLREAIDSALGQGDLSGLPADLTSITEGLDGLLNDLSGVISTTALTTALTSLTNLIPSLDTLETRIESMFGIAPGDLDLEIVTLASGHRAVIVRLTLSDSYSDPAIPLDFQVGGSGIPLAVDTGGTLSLSATASLQLDFGFDLTSLSPFLLDTSSATVTLGAESTNLTVTISLGGVTGAQLGKAGDEGIVSLKTKESQSFTGTGAQTVFALAPALSATQRKLAIVTVNDIIQPTGVTVTAANVTFAAAPANGAAIKVFYPGATDASAGFTLNDLSPDADGIIPFTEIALSSFGFNIDGLVNAKLPVYLPIGASSVGDLRFFMDLNDFDSLYAALPTDIAASLATQDCDPTLMLDGIGLFLDLLQAGLESDILQNLPVIGDGVTLAGTFIDDLRSMVTDLQDDIDDADTVIQNVIYGYIGSILVDESGNPISSASDIDVTVGGDACVEINLHLKGTETLATDFDLGLDAFIFSVSTSGGVEINLGYDIQLGLGFNLTEGFYLTVNTDASDPEGEFTLDVGLASGTSINAELFFLKLGAVDGGDTGILGTLDVNLVDPNSDGKLTMTEISSASLLDIADIAVTAGIKIDLDITVDIVDNPGVDPTFPRLTANLYVDWPFLGNDGLTGQQPTVSFNDVTLELGTFLSRLLGPTLSAINDMIAPIKPILDFLNSDIPVINDISQFLGQGEVKFVDIIRLFAPAEADTIDTFITVLDTVANIADDISGLGTSSISMNFGDFDFGGGVDLRDPDVTVSSASGTLSGDTAESDFDTAKSGGGLVGSIMSGIDTLQDYGLDFPLITNPANIFNLLMGQRVDLVTWDIPRLEASIDYEQRFGPLWVFPPVFARIFGSLTVFADLGIGIDTRAFENGFDLLNGFYFRDFKDGHESPELGLSLTIGAGAEISVVVARAGIEGGITANLTADWNDVDDDGKIYLDELWQQLSQGPCCIFDLGGSLDAYLRAYAEIGIDTFLFGFITLWSADITLVDVTLFDFSISCPPLPPPVLAHVSDGTDGFAAGTLITHFGPYASQRQPGAVDDKDKIDIMPALDETTGLPIPGAYVVKAIGLEQTYTGVTSIYANGGDFDDDITVDFTVTIPATLIGGEGNDHLDGGAGNDSISGGNGNDWITGNDGNDTLNGDGGNDALFGGKGNDRIYAGEGIDQVYGEDGNDSLEGGDGDDIMYGDSKPNSSGAYSGTGNDTLKGGEGNDQLYGAGGNDSIEGGDGADLIEADAGDDTARGDAGDDIIRGWDGNDLLYGGDGNDVLRGYSDEPQGSNPDNDTMFGDAGFDDMGGNKGDDFMVGGTQADALLGGEGNDTLLGGWGDDIIRGQAGTDYIEGGPNDDNICGQDGNETIYGGTALLGFPYIVLGYVDPYTDGGFSAIDCDSPIHFIPPTLIPTGEGSLTGQKFHDLNGDGAQDPGETGLNRWVIQLYDAAGTLLASQLTTSVDLNSDGSIDPQEEQGVYSFAGLPPGDYTIAEVPQKGWVQSRPTSPIDAALARAVYKVHLNAEHTLDDLDFGNYQQGNIQGHKFWDRDGDGHRDIDPNDPFMNGWTIQLYNEDNVLVDQQITGPVDLNGDSQIDPATEVGAYQFTGLAPGFYRLVEVVPQFWMLTAAPAPLTLTSGQTSSGNDFGNTLTGGHVFGTKWDDLNANGKRDTINFGSTSIQEPGLAGVTIYADLNGNNMLDAGEPSTLTLPDNPATEIDETGMYWLADLPDGNYEIREVAPPGYRQTYPIDPAGLPAGHPVQIIPGAIFTGKDFGNTRQLGSLSGQKFNDKNKDGKRQTNEPGLYRWMIYLDANNNAVHDDGEIFALTSENGAYSFPDLPAGHYVVREVPQPGWSQTAPAGGAYTIDLPPGGNLAGLDFANAFGSLTGTNLADTYYATLDTQHTRFLVYQGSSPNGLPLINEPLVNFDTFSFTLRGGNDTLILDFANGNPIPAGGMTFDGGSSTDTLMLLGSPEINDRGGVEPVDIVFNGARIAFDGLENIHVAGRGGDDSLSLDFTTVDSFFDVFTELSFDGGSGNDSLVVNAPAGFLIDSFFDVFFDGGDGNDLLQFGKNGAPNAFDRFDNVSFIGGLGDDTLSVNDPLPKLPGFIGGPGSNTLAISAGIYNSGAELNGLNLSLVSDGSVKFLNDVSLRSLLLAGNGKLNLGTNDLLLATGNLDAIEADIRAARNGGLWNKPGLTTSAANAITTLGVIPKSNGILVKFTWYGDVNGDGVVNLNDYFTIDTGYLAAAKNYKNGDVNFDGAINLNDYFLIDSAYLGQGAPLGSLTPPAPGGEIHGLKWNDANGNGIRESAESGISGVTIYLDANGNGRRDTGEPSTTTLPDDPSTPTINELGMYDFVNLAAGTYRVSEVIPTGYTQTAPSSGSYVVTVVVGQPITNRNFGNRRNSGDIHGSKWRDDDGDGVRDDDESGLPGVTIYLDANNNGQPDLGEDSVLTVNDNLLTTTINERGRYEFFNLPAGSYRVREVVPAGYTQTAPAAGSYLFTLAAGQIVNNINFGNQPKPGGISGTKYNDLDGDGTRDAVEPGMAGVMIYLDANNNAFMDTGEKNLATAADGSYSFTNLTPGTYIVREVVPTGLTQTAPASGSHNVLVDPGEIVTNLNFGNRRQPGQIHGTKWRDDDGDGKIGPNESGIPGVTIYLDHNNDGKLDPNEPSTLTRTDNPQTPTVNETGLYSFFDVFVDITVVREVVPSGYTQTFPAGGAGHPVNLTPGQIVTNLNFGNRRQPGQIHGAKWNDYDRDGQRGPNETGIPGVTIYLDGNNNGQLDAGERSTVTLNDNPNTRDDETGQYSFTNLDPGRYFVREIVPAGWAQTAPVDSFFDVFVELGQIVPGLDFGNRERGGDLGGTKWNDLDGDGVRDSNEPGMPGVTIFLDLNYSGALDPGEPSTLTSSDDPKTPTVNETGQYYFLDLPPNSYMIREIVPPGYIQTYPESGYHYVYPVPGQPQTHFDFGNSLPRPGGLGGTKWLDTNGNGIRDLVPNPTLFAYAEPGLAGVTIYLDLNNNGALDPKEPYTITAFDNPGTPGDETGQYSFSNLPAGQYIVREVVPFGFLQTAPPEGLYVVNVLPGQTLPGLNFGNQPTPGEVHGTKFNDLNGDGARGHHEPGLPGVIIYADLNNNGRRDEGEPWTLSMTDNPETPAVDETGEYWLAGLPPGPCVIREIVPKDYLQTAPAAGAYLLEIQPGQIVRGKDFGNRLRPGTIIGTKWEDADADRQRDPSEPGLGGVIIYVDYDNDGHRDYNEPWTTTNPDGSYTITDVNPGTNSVREQLPAGMAQSYPGVALIGHNLTGALYDISTTTGLASNPRPTASGMVGISLSFANDKLYSLTTAGKLLTVHPTAGTFGAVASVSFTPQEGDIDFDPTTGRLYGLWAGARTLYIINTSSGAATAVGSLPATLPDPSAMAFNAAGDLYVIDAQALKLVQVNKATGAAIRTVSLVAPAPLGTVAGMTFDPLSQTLYLATGVGAASAAALYTVNILTGQLAKIGNTGADISGLEFIPLDHHVVSLNPGQTVGQIDFGNYETQILPDGNDTIHGNAGNDTIYGDNGGGFPPTIVTIGGDDVISGGSGADLLYGQDENDLIKGGGDNDLIYGNEGDDTMDGQAGNDTVEGSLGDDTYAFSDSASPTTDLINEFAGEGNDTVDFSSVTTTVSFDMNVQSALRTGNLTINMQDGFGNPGQLNFDNAIGSHSAVNTLTGHAGDNRLTGGSNNDTITGDAGTNYLFGRDGDDTFIPVLGNDDEIYGDGGYDRLDYSAFTASVQVNLQTRTATGVAFFDAVELFVGSSFFDVFVGMDLDTTWHLTAPDAGNLDEIPDAYPGPVDFVSFENLTGGSAADVFAFNDGASVSGALDGDAGIDTLDYSLYTTSVTVDLTAGTATGTGGIINIENATGGSAADKLTGDANANVLLGNGGDDTLLGMDGNDSLGGGGGNDTLDGGFGDDLLVGEAGNDSLLGGEGHDGLLGGNDNDTLDGGNGNDALVGEAGDDLLLGGDGNDSLAGMAGNDQIDGGNGDDLYYMTDAVSTDTLIEAPGGGNDTLTYQLFATPVTVDRRTNTATGATGLANIESVIGGAAADILIGEDLPNVWHITAPDAGDINAIFFFSSFERLVGGLNTDTFQITPPGSISGSIDGGGGYDTLDLSALPGPVQVNLATMTATAIANFANLELFLGSAASDTLLGANLANTWRITAPNAGNIGGPGLLDFSSFENLTGGTAADTFMFNDGMTLTGLIAGGGGADTLDFQLYTTPIAANLQTSSITGAAGFSSIERLKGGAAADILVGSNVANTWHISSLNGGDIGAPGVFDFTGIENLTGGAAADTFTFANTMSVSGTIDGRIGFDYLDYSAYATSVQANLTLNTATAAAAIANIEGLRGGAANDILIGSALANTLVGNNGDDILVGNAGNDNLDGGFGRDLIIGGDGADTLLGRDGDDILIGGFTTHDANVPNLQNILTRWTAASAYAARVTDLKTTAPKLSPGVEVFNDADIDNLTGGNDSDWFFKENAVDIITDPAAGETIDAF
jgi:Ca2+-binding RTX toxin-like protein